MIDSPETSEDADKPDYMLRVEHLKKHFPVIKGSVFSMQTGVIKAVDDVSFRIKKGETLGVVGESGCGKSTLGRTVLRLHRPTSGNVFLGDTNVTDLSYKALRPMRPRMQMIFQDSYDSLNPRHSIGKIIAEPMVVHTQMDRGEMDKRVCELLDIVGLNPNHAQRFPHEFSGGQRQRINIARALALNPEFVVCDEPISALDVSIQAQIVNLFQDLKKDLGLTFLFIAHDLSMVQHVSDRVAVMYLGKIMELTDRATLFRSPLHPYTKALISAVPLPDPKRERERVPIMLTGEVPSPANPPKGCVFSSRCPEALDICFKTEPEYRDIGESHFIACHLL